MINWEDWVVDIEKKHEGIMNLFSYILRESGGIVWPILYTIILWQTWDVWNDLGKILFVIIGSILMIISFIYPRTWESWAKKKAVQLEEERERIEKDCNERINRMAGKFNNAQSTALTLYSWHKSGKPWPNDLNEAWDKLYKDFIQS